jgi:5-oxoprolinase (ATP-hydrolysing)
MPPNSRHIDHEGVLIDALRIVNDGQLDQAAVIEALSAGPHPARQITQNLADLSAQLAANQRGLNEIDRMIEQFGRERVLSAMDDVQANATEHVREVIDQLSNGQWSKILDNGARIQVAVEVDHDQRSARIDFSGSSAQLADNFNAPAAITRACVLYALRCLVKADIPLNDGCLVPIELIIPEGSLLNPKPPAAVVAGNVETSQALTDALLAAMGAQANSQGTMNNLTFGDAEHQHYETICGGSGAGPEFNGCDAVQVHMTNSRLTDPEVLEMRFPVRLDAFGVRHGSGGEGRWSGGCGAVRRIRFLAPMTVAVLATSRRVAPSGLHGGGDGATGRAWIERSDGRLAPLLGCDHATVEPGDVVVIETPGGGGWGPVTRS